MRRILFVREGCRATPVVRFGGDDILDHAGIAGSRALRPRMPARAEFLTGGSLAAAQTGALAGLGAPRLEPALAEWDFGRWGSRSLDDVLADEPDAVEAWLTDPTATPHGGESGAAVVLRIAQWLDGQAGQDGSAVAVTGGAVIRAAVVTALASNPAALWRVDVAPLSITELRGRHGRWNVVRLNDCAHLAAAARRGRAEHPPDPLT